MPLNLYNTNVREKQVFEPLNPPYVGIYVCGPTVSGESHLGHARTYISFDVLYRYLLKLGYKVRYVRNITDAGHFEEEDRDPENKVDSKAKLEKLEPMEIVQKYTRGYHKGMEAYNTLPPTIEPTATGHIIEQIEMIKQLIADGYAYEVNNSVYFDVHKYAAQHNYGQLSGRKIDELLEQTRLLDGQEDKRNSADFALWKKAEPEHIMQWPSPWGLGFPGWHIECSAMATKYLGKQFDIHGGGMDLLFPHHESEIAQSTICNGVSPVKYWVHTNMITVNGQKMGKSYNNAITTQELLNGTHPLLTQAYSPTTVRFFVLQSHYRSTLDFGNEALQASEKAFKRLWESYENLNKLNASEVNQLGIDDGLEAKVNELVNEFELAINDDLNTAKVIGAMFELAPIINALKNKQTESGKGISTATFAKLKSEFKIYLEDVLGMTSPSQENNTLTNEAIQLLLNLRNTAKANKNFTLSDSIRNDLQKIGVQVKDEKNGSSTYTVN